MRVIVYGAGAVGGVLGGFLSLAGTPVALIGRPARVRAIKAGGLDLITPAGRHTLRIPAVTSPDQIEFMPGDVVFLCVKSQGTERAILDLWAVIRDVPVFCFQNGVRNEETAARHFPDTYGVMVRMGAVFLEDREAVAVDDPPGWLIMGRYPSGTDALVSSVAAVLRVAGFLVKPTAEVMPYKWGKLLANVNNVVAAIAGIDIHGGKNTLEDADMRAVVAALQRETREILDKAGIRLITAAEVREAWPEVAQPLRGHLEVAGRGSTRQSLLRRSGTVETGALNGEIVRMAASLGMDAPVNEGLVGIIGEMARNRELPGAYTPAQLRAMLGLAR